MKFVLCVFISIVLVGCQSDPETTLFVNTQADDSVPLSLITDDVRIVKLETKDESLLRTVNHLALADEFIFVGDFDKILKFDRDGKFIRSIGSKGQGPGEYRSIYALAVDKKEEILYIAAPEKILSYTFDGELLNELKRFKMPSHIQTKEGQLYVLSSEMGEAEDSFQITGKLFDVDTNGEVTDSATLSSSGTVPMAGISIAISPPGNPYLSYADGKRFAYYRGLVLIPRPTGRDTLFQILNNELQFSTVLDFGFDEKDDDHTLFVYSMSRTDGFLFSSYLYNGIQRLFCYDFESAMAYNMTEGFTDDFYNTGKVRIRFTNTEPGETYFAKDAIDVIDKIEGIAEDANPVLFLFTLKE